MYKKKNERSFRDGEYVREDANNRKIPCGLSTARPRTASSRKVPDWFIRVSVYKRRRFHFRIGTRRQPNRSAHHQEKVSFAYAAVQFPRDVSISAGQRASFRCIQFRGAPFISRPAIHIANARFHYFRSGDRLTPPIQNYHAVYDCCIRSRRKLRLPVAMKKNDLWRNHIVLSLPFSVWRNAHVNGLYTSVSPFEVLDFLKQHQIFSLKERSKLNEILHSRGNSENCKVRVIPYCASHNLLVTYIL